MTKEYEEDEADRHYAILDEGTEVLEMECPNYKICYNSGFAEDGNTKIAEHSNTMLSASYLCKYCNSKHIIEIVNIGQEGSELGIDLMQCLVCKLVWVK
mgnify:CR=1 FL=1